VEVSLPQYKSKKEREEMKEQPDYSGCTKYNYIRRYRMWNAKVASRSILTKHLFNDNGRPDFSVPLPIHYTSKMGLLW